MRATKANEFAELREGVRPAAFSGPQNFLRIGTNLLCRLDGFYAPTGVLFMMTTNHFEKLDPALLRPGRIDYRLYLGMASDDQKVELFRRFFPEASDAEARAFVKAAPPAETMAEFQGLLLARESEGCSRVIARAPVERRAEFPAAVK